ncbi:hypothetical protein [Nocardioides sediminis]|uniref:hypothetical protein n=1 Tax=Nocardioides sediminis TaxID=433648 RepID=UPI00131EE6F6|nr:hypothetical protein [Nocardioides sediminis]
MDQQHSDEPGSADPGRHDLEGQDLDRSDLEGTEAEGGPDEVATGVGEVDAVLATLDRLADRPVAEHVEVFEKAHERLRRALDTPAD